MIQYIVICGAPRSGRTAFARELVYHLKPSISESFDAPLKHLIAAGLGDTFKAMNKEKMRPELGGYSVDDFLARLRRDFFSCFGPNDMLAHWLIHRSLRYPWEKPGYVVVDDCSSPEQLDALPNKYIIRIVRPDVTLGWLRHWDAIVINDGKAVDLWTKAKNIAEQIKEGKVA